MLGEEYYFRELCYETTAILDVYPFIGSTSVEGGGGKDRTVARDEFTARIGEENLPSYFKLLGDLVIGLHKGCNGFLCRAMGTSAQTVLSKELGIPRSPLQLHLDDIIAAAEDEATSDDDVVDLS